MDVRSETIKATVGRFLMGIIRFGTTVILARLVPPGTFGAMYLLLRSGTIISKIASGWAISSKKQLLELSVDGEKRQVVGAVLLVTAAWIILTTAISILGASYLRRLTGFQFAAIFLASVVAVESSNFVAEKLVEGKQDIATPALVRAGRFGIALVLQTSLVAGGYGAVGFFVGFVVASMVSGGILFATLGYFPSSPELSLFQSQWEFAKHSTPNLFLSSIYGSLDIFLISVLVSNAAAGYYQGAWTLTAPVTFVGIAAGSSVMASISDDSEYMDEEVRRQIEQTLHYVSILAIPLFFGSVAIGREVVLVLYGERYSGAIPLLIGLSLFQIFRTQSLVLLESLNGIGRPDLLTKVTILALLINLAVGTVLTLQFGPIGVVVATIFAELIRLCWLRRSVKRIAGTVRILGFPQVKQIGAGLAVAVFAYVMSSVWEISTLPELMTIVGCGGLIYLTTLVATDGEVRAQCVRSFDQIRSILTSQEQL